MDPTKTDQVAEIVEQALEVGVGERGALIVDLCGGDQDLFVEVASLLQFQDSARDFIETPAVEEVAEILAGDSGELKANSLLGNYKIVSLIGEGGMGEVYLAEDKSLGRTVAIKVLKLGLGTASIIRHFHDEERILAGLTHPNIAQLYGGEVTDNGLPYFVMEYVEGARVDDYCRSRALPIPDRLELFRKICSAVAYAHQHLVVHRDLKPANVRVTAEGEPKLLDFGIAKLLDPATASIEATMTFAGAMTPVYASPEQVRGENITTASDVYSLGVILYELLTEQKPYHIDKRTPTAVAKAITEQEPARPSVALARGQRSEVRDQRLEIRNQKLLRGDLDNIVLKALRKEPERRYASVAQFSEDIRRYLEGKPVTARQGTFNYRAGKFIKRNRIAVAAAVIVLLSLVGGIVGTTIEARRADRRFNDVRRLADSLMFEIHDSVKDLQGSTPTRRLIVNRALEYLDSLAHDAGNSPTLQRDLATAYEKVGDIQGNPFNANLGDTDGALASYRKALAIRESLRGPPTVDSQMEMGRTYRGLGDILEQKGDITQTISNYRRSLSVFEQLESQHPSEFFVQDELARAHETLGDGLGRAANSGAERLEEYQTALKIRQQLLAEQSSNPKIRRSVALTFLKVGATSDPKKPETIANVQHGIEMLEVLSTEDPNNARARREVGYAYYQLGNSLEEAGDFAGALTARRKAFAIRERIAAEDPKNAQARFDLAVAHGDLSEALTATGEYKNGLEEARKSLSIMEELCNSDSTNAVYRRNLGLSYEKIGDVWAGIAANEAHAPREEISDWTQARDWYRKAADLFLSLRTTGKLMPADTAEPDKFTAEILKCDRAIKELEK